MLVVGPPIVVVESLQEEGDGTAQFDLSAVADDDDLSSAPSAVRPSTHACSLEKPSVATTSEGQELLYCSEGERGI